MDSDKYVQRRRADIPERRPTSSSYGSKHHEQVVMKKVEVAEVIRLLTDPVTVNLKRRHLLVLKKLLQRCRAGFILKELRGMRTILNVCAEKAEDQAEYVVVLCEALRICGLPFLKEKASDELRYAQDVVDFLSSIGCLMRVPVAEVRRQVVESVKSFYSCLDGTERVAKTKPGIPRLDKQLPELSPRLQPTCPGYTLQLLERSELAKTLLLSMAALENQPAIKLQLLQTLKILSSSSDMNCVSLLRARGAEAMCLHMNEPDPSGQVLAHSCEILWNLLERGSMEEVTAQLCSMECVVSLKEAFLNQLSSGPQHGDLRLRNDLLVFTIVVAENLASLLVETLFAKQLVALATFPELKSNNPLVHNLKLNYGDEEMKTKKLLLHLLVFMSKDSASLRIFKEERVMLALLTFMKPPDDPSQRRPGSRYWSPIQQEEMQLQALAALASIAPLMLDEFMSCQGNTFLMLLLDWCFRREDHVGLLSSGAAEGDIVRKAQLQNCVRVLRSVTSAGDDAVNQDLCDQGIIKQLLGILMQMEVRPDEDDVVVTEIKSDVQLILSLLCESDMHRKELFGSEGVEMTIHYLRKGANNFYSGLGHNKLMLSTVDCVWSCIVGCYTTEDYFLAKEGVFLLLDLLNSSPRCLHCNILATLLELCDNQNTLAHLLSWRDDCAQTAPRLLLQLWSKEEEELGVSRNHRGGIADLQRPIVSLNQQEVIQQSLPGSVPSAAVLEISENLRSKIYVIFCKLGFEDHPGLSAEHHVTLSIVRNYLDFKVGEVWEEISRELAVDGVRPVSPDEEALGAISKISEKTARTVAAEQSSLMEQQKKEEIREEGLLYTEMKSRWKQQELTDKSWNDYVSKTSHHEILKKVRTQREKFSEATRPKPKQDAKERRPAEAFIGEIMSFRTTDEEGPAGVSVMLARTPFKTLGQDEVAPATRDAEYLSIVSVKD